VAFWLLGKTWGRFFLRKRCFRKGLALVACRDVDAECKGAVAAFSWGTIYEADRLGGCFDSVIGCELS
jgi:hypothetical protein